VLAKLEAFSAAGGVVIGGEFLPSRSLDPKVSDAAVDEQVRRIWNPSNEKVAHVPETSAASLSSFLHESGVRPTLEVLEGETYEWFYVLHCQKAGCDIFFLHNACTFNDVELTLSVEAQSPPELWDPRTGERCFANFTQASDGRFVGKLTLSNLQALVLVAERQG
jgi:hypothetical protein